jgi:hypothetical protein
VVAGYFGFLPDANFCFSSLIQASISLQLAAAAIGALATRAFLTLPQRASGL